MKNSMKRALASALSLCLLLSLTLTQALAAPSQTGTCGDNIHWSFDNGTLTIDGTGPMDNYDTDDTPWSELTVKKVVLKEGVTSLGDGAFGWCEELRSIKLPKSLRKIGIDALNGTSLKEVKVTKGSKYFSARDGVLFNKNKSVLYYYPSLKKGKSYTIPSSVKTIASGAFCGSEGLCGANPYLKKVVFPKKLKKIQSYAFAWSNVETLRFPSGNPALHEGCLDGVSAVIRYPKKHKKCWSAALKSYLSTYESQDDSCYPDLKLKSY